MVGPIIGNGFEPLAALRRAERASPLEEFLDRRDNDRLSPAEAGRSDPATGAGGGLIDPVRVDGVSIAQEVGAADLSRRVVDRQDTAEERRERADTRETSYLARDEAFVERERLEQVEAVEDVQRRVDERRALEDGTADTLQENLAQANAAAFAQGAVAQQAGAQAVAGIPVDRRPEGEGAGRVTPVRPVDLRV